MRDLARLVRGEPLPSEVRRLLRWWTVRWVVRVGAVVTAAVLLVELVVSWGASEREPVSASAPTLTEIDAAIGAAEGAAADIEVSQVGGDPDEPITVALGERHLADWVPATADRSVTTHVEAADRGLLRSLRYTVRHVAMLATSAYRYRGDPGRAERLDALVTTSGYDADADVYAPVWGLGRAEPDDFVFEPAVYRDCHDPAILDGLPDATLYYPYRSKVCTIPTWGYVAMSREDPLAPLAQGLHILQRYADAEHEYSDGEHLNTTVLSLAEDLERRFRAAGGIAECLPGSCDSGSTSTLRTVLFGMVETELGFGRGDDVSRTYADAVAAEILHAQVGADGLIATTTLGDLYRPDQSGGFFTHVTSDGRSGEPDSYRCARFGVGCSAWPGDR